MRLAYEIRISNLLNKKSNFNKCRLFDMSLIFYIKIINIVKN